MIYFLVLSQVHCRGGVGDMWKNMAKERSFSEKERICEFTFRDAEQRIGPFWHVCTPGNLTEILNVTEEDYSFAVSNAAISAYESGVVVITDAYMENHIHDILGGSLLNCLSFVDKYRFRLHKHLVSTGRDVNLSKFRCDDPIQITSLEMMRNEIIYVNRNGYVDDPRYLPYSYPWGGGCLYFNPSAQNDKGIPYNELPFVEKRGLCCRRVSLMPNNYQVKGKMILPASYVQYKLGQSMFRDAHHYFQALTRNVEAFCESAKRLGDKNFLGREEMYPAVSSLCLKNYNVKQPSQLPKEEKIAVARTMHYEYHATNAQIRMILGLTDYEVDSLFPKL